MLFCGASLPSTTTDRIFFGPVSPILSSIFTAAFNRLYAAAVVYLYYSMLAKGGDAKSPVHLWLYPSRVFASRSVGGNLQDQSVNRKKDNSYQTATFLCD